MTIGCSSKSRTHPLHPQPHPVLSQELFEGAEKAPYKVTNIVGQVERTGASLPPGLPAPPLQTGCLGLGWVSQVWPGA